MPGLSTQLLRCLKPTQTRSNTTSFWGRPAIAVPFLFLETKMINIRNLSFRYSKSSRTILDGITLDWSKGETILVTGRNGSGKTTLVKIVSGIIPYYTGGIIEGDVLINSTPVEQSNLIKRAGNLGIVLQDPLTQVTNLTVWDEVVFGIKNLMLSPYEIYKKSHKSLEIMGLINIQERETLYLSGGELQRLSIAGLLSMNPEILLLDEPTANLDPRGIASIVKTIEILQQRAPLIIIVSHQGECFLDVVNRIITLDQGTVIDDCDVNQYRKAERNPSYDFEYMHSYLSTTVKGKIIFEGKHMCFSYPNGPLILNDIDMVIREHERIILTGANGEGKTTLAKIISGLLKPKGKLFSTIRRVAYIPQQPSLSFLGNSVIDELTWGLELSEDEVDDLLHLFSLSDLKNHSPFQLSGGEQKRLSLATSFAMKPDLLILDEPTAGLDQHQVDSLLNYLSTFTGSIILITHDIRVLANNSYRLIVLYGGNIIFDNMSHLISADIAIHLGLNLINPSIKYSVDHNIWPIVFGNNDEMRFS